MNIDQLVKKALRLEFLSVAQGLTLYESLPLPVLMSIGFELRKLHNPDMKVTWIIDRNVNITNGCISGCKFCNFYRPLKHDKVYIATIEELPGLSAFGETPEEAAKEARVAAEGFIKVMERWTNIPSIFMASS